MNGGFKRRLRQWATRLGASAPTPGLVRWAVGRGRTEATILCYHDVASIAGPGCVEAKRFEAQARYLAAEARVVPLNEIVGLVSGGAAGNGRVVSITFDDGLSGPVQNAFPVLRSLSLPFSVFVIRERAERRLGPFASLAEIRDGLGAIGTFGAHGVSHDRPLTELSDQELAHEMNGSIDLLRGLDLPEGQRFFCYPWARHDARVEEACRQAGFDAAFAGSWRRFHSTEDRYRLGRVTIDGDDDMRLFRAKLAGGRDLQAEWLRFRGRA